VARGGTQTRERLIQAAQELILGHGYTGASIDKVLAETGLTKGAFFYHFRNKAELGRAVMQRYADNDRRMLDEALAQAQQSTPDPLQQLLTIIELYIEQFEQLAGPMEGCMYASYVYQAKELEQASGDIAREALLYWRHTIGRLLREAMERHPPRIPVDPERLADHLVAIGEGAHVLSMALDDPAQPVEALNHLRNYLELLFGLRD
jgi:TetR/AcrR family transcriptional repressor of nem operon